MMFVPVAPSMMFIAVAKAFRPSRPPPVKRFIMRSVIASALVNVASPSGDVSKFIASPMDCASTFVLSSLRNSLYALRVPPNRFAISLSLSLSGRYGFEISGLGVASSSVSIPVIGMSSAVSSSNKS